jgi:hypothetical protein
LNAYTLFVLKWGAINFKDKRLIIDNNKLLFNSSYRIFNKYLTLILIFFNVIIYMISMHVRFCFDLSYYIKSLFGSAVEPAFDQISIFFFLLKLSAVCTFWIVLMCWCQKWFLKNKKISLACISARKVIWKATTTTLPNTL